MSPSEHQSNKSRCKENKKKINATYDVPTADDFSQK